MHRSLLLPSLAGLVLLLMAGLPLTGGCGGGEEVAPPAATPTPGPQDVRIEGGQVALTLTPQGLLAAVTVTGVPGQAAAADPQPLLVCGRGGAMFPVEDVVREGDRLRARFDAGTIEVGLDLEEAASHVGFRVASVSPDDVETLRLQITLARRSEVDPILNGTYDDDAILSLRSVNAPTRCAYKSLAGGIPQPAVEWTSRHGIVGGEAAFLATPRAAFFDAASALQVAKGLPSPRFDGLPARLSPTARESYLFLTYYQDGDLPALLEYAQLGEFGLILVLRGLWRESAGTYGLDPTLWPGGLPAFQAFCAQIRDAGLGVGLHFYGPSISLNDPLVTPVPDPGLLGWPLPPLGTGIDAATTSFEVTALPELPPNAGGGFPGRYVRLGDEIVQYASRSTSAPYTFTGCTRGALGTTATSHDVGTVGRHLATVNDLFLIDPDSPLVDTVAANLGNLVNAASIDMVYFDGSAVVPTNEFVQRWYYMNRLFPAYDQAFDHSVLVQTGLGPGRELDWHLVPRSASADGHGDIKWYLDERTPSINTIRRGFSVPDVGWYGFDSGRPPDYLEYVCAKCLGWSCGLSVQTFKIELEKDRRARETVEMIGRYERCKRSGALPPAMLERLLTPGQDFRLLEDDAQAYHLFEATYDRPRDVRTLTAGASTWTAFNPEAEACPLGVEITRGDAIRVDADFGDPGRTTLDAFIDAAPYVPGGANDSARLVNRVQKVVGSAGPARAGVEHALSLASDPSVGGTCTQLSATNPNNTIGWCAVGRLFDPVLDLGGQEALGLWVKGDRSGTELRIELYDDQDRRTVVTVPVFFEGWRFHTFDFSPPAAFDAARVTYLTIIAADLAPGSTVELCFASFRATPAVRAAANLSGVEFEVGGRMVALPADLPPGGTARIDGLGRITQWSGGMLEGTTTALAGGPVLLPAGSSPVTFRTSGPAVFPGDVVVRLSRLKKIHPE